MRTENSAEFDGGGIPVDEQHFPDENFRNYVIEYCADQSGFLSYKKIADVSIISVDGYGIASLKGIEYFTALTSLYCYGNLLTQLDVSRNTALDALFCGGNQLKELDISSNTALTILSCDENLLAQLDVSSNTALESLWCDKNKLAKLDVRNNTALKELGCVKNQLTQLDVGNNTALENLQCSGNRLNELDISNIPKLITAYTKGEYYEESGTFIRNFSTGAKDEYNYDINYTIAADIKTKITGAEV